MRSIMRQAGWLTLTVMALPAVGQRAPTLVGTAVALGAGQFAWGATSVRGGRVAIVVSIPLQQLFVYRGKALVAVSAVSTGNAGHETPTGEFTILQKDVDHRSNKYSDAPMPYMQRLTWDGIAIHGGRDPGYPASHGCIRVPLAFARRLYAITMLGAHVSVIDDTSAPGLPVDYDTDRTLAKAAAQAAAIDPETAATKAANMSPIVPAVTSKVAPNSVPSAAAIPDVPASAPSATPGQP